MRASLEAAYYPGIMDPVCRGQCRHGTSGLGLQAPSHLASRNYQATVNVTEILGSHTLRFGSDVRQQVFTSMGPGYTSGNFAFDNTYTRRNDDTAVAPAGNLGLSWAAFMLGIPTTSSVDANDSYATVNPYYSGYIQDSWRVTPKLTLNFGLRFEYEAGMTERYNRMLVGWDPTLQLPISAAAAAMRPRQVFRLHKAFWFRAGPGTAKRSGARQASPRASRVPSRQPTNQPKNGGAAVRVYYDTLNVSIYFQNSSVSAPPQRLPVQLRATWNREILRSLLLGICRADGTFRLGTRA